jgi:beta-lactamase regulating signal transducer with metallopeptidase domain
MAMASTLFTQILLERILNVLTGAVPAGGTEALRSFAERLAHAAAPVAVTALWQGAVVAAGLALCMRLAPRVGAAHRFAAWAAGFSVLVALPFVPVLSRLMAASAGAGSNTGAASLPSSAAHGWMAHPWLQINDRWSLAIAALWLVMALARAVDLGIHTARLRRLWKTAALRAVFPLDEMRGSGARQPKFEVCTTRELDRPSVIGFFAPRILIPEWLMERLTQHELEQVVLHEAEHLRRRDDWTNLLQKLCLVIFPLNPALMFVERRLCREREMACDEGVVRRTQAPRAYAACLAGLAERHMEHRAEALSLGARAKALTLSAFERRPELARRVHSILMRRGAMDPVASRALLGAVGCALAVGAVVLARCPQLVAFVPAEPKVRLETAQAVPEQLRGDKLMAASTRQMEASGFRAVNAMAIMPGITQRDTTRCRTSFKANSHTGETKIQPTARYRRSLVSAPGNGADTVADAVNRETAIPQELIVLTAYEQVQSSGDALGDRVVSDNGASYESGIAANGASAGGSARRITITRLIFRVYPRVTAGARESDGPNEPAAPSGSTATAGQKPLAAIPTSVTSDGATTQPTNQMTGRPASQANGSASGQALRPDTNSQTGWPHAVALGNGWFVIQL